MMVFEKEATNWSLKCVSLFNTADAKTSIIDELKRFDHKSTFSKENKTYKKDRRTHRDQKRRWPSQTSSSYTEHCGPHPEPEHRKANSVLYVFIAIMHFVDGKKIFRH